MLSREINNTAIMSKKLLKTKPSRHRCYWTKDNNYPRQVSSKVPSRL